MRQYSAPKPAALNAPASALRFDGVGLIDAGLRLGMLPVLVVCASLPPSALQTLLPACLFDSLLDIECWGCGLSRALMLGLQGRILDAVAVNALAVPVLLVLAALFVQQLNTLLKGRPAHA